MSREIIQTSFNMDDEFEKELYHYVKSQGVASKFIKRLIFMHKEGMKSSTPSPVTTPKPNDDKVMKAMNTISL